MTSRIIAAGAFRMALYVAAAKVLIAAREIVFAAYYGVGPIMDAYNVAMTAITWLPILLAGAAGSAIVPALIREDGSSRTRESKVRFIGELNGTAILAAAVVTMLGVAIALTVPKLMAADPASTRLAIRLSMLLAPFAGLTALFYYLSIRLQAQGAYSYSLVEALPALTVVAAIVCFYDRWPISLLAAGTLVGGVLQVAILALMIRRRDTAIGSARFSRRHPAWRGVAGAIGAMAIGQVLLSVSLPLDQYVAFSVGTGAAATLGYAQRLIGLGTSVGTLVLARALLPTLAALARDAPAEARKQALFWSAAAFAAGLAGSLAGWILAEPITRWAFERGQFDPADTQAVAALIRWGCLQLPFYFGGIVAVQWLAVCGRYSAVAWVAAATIVAKLVFLGLLAPLGIQDIMLSTVGMYVVAWIAQTWLMLGTRSAPAKRSADAS